MEEDNFGYHEESPRGLHGCVLVAVVSIISAILWVVEKIKGPWPSFGFFGGMSDEDVQGR